MEGGENYWGRSSFQRCQHMTHMEGLSHLLSALSSCSSSQWGYCQASNSWEAAVCAWHRVVCSQSRKSVLKLAYTSSHWLVLANPGSWEPTAHIFLWLRWHLIGTLKSGTVGAFYTSETCKFYKPGILSFPKSHLLKVSPALQLKRPSSSPPWEQYLLKENQPIHRKWCKDNSV